MVAEVFIMEGMRGKRHNTKETTMDFAQAKDFFNRTDLFKTSSDIIDWVLANPNAESHVVFAAGLATANRQREE